jgi:isoleucyl-tRNA synthetase
LEKRLDVLYKDLKKAKFSIVQRFKGLELKGKRYLPLFPYFANVCCYKLYWIIIHKFLTKRSNSFIMLTDGYVTDDSGTGIVHQAPAFGEDDNRVCLAHGVITKDENIPCPVDESGVFTDDVPDFKGQYVKVRFII